MSFKALFNLMKTKYKNKSHPKIRINSIEETANGFVANHSNNADIIELLSPISLMMRVLGTWPQHNSHNIWQRMSPWNGITLFVLHFYSFEILAENILRIGTKSSLLSQFVQMSAFIRASVVMIVIDIRFVYHQKVLKLFRDMSVFPTFSDEYDLKNLSKNFKNIKSGFIVFAVIQILISIDAVFREPSDPFIELIVGKWHSNSGLFLFEVILRVFKWFCYLFFVIFNECSNKLYFFCICLIIRNKIKDFNSYLKHLEISNTICSIDEIQQIYKMSCVLTSFTESIEDYFSVQSFLWIFSVVINLCAKIQVIITEVKGKDSSLLSFTLMDLFYLAIVFVSILLISDEVGDRSCDPGLSVTKLGENGDINDSNFQQLIQILNTKLNTPSIRLTGWNCFELNKSFLLTVMGALVTYSVVVLQIT